MSEMTEQAISRFIGASVDVMAAGPSGDVVAREGSAYAAWDSRPRGSASLAEQGFSRMRRYLALPSRKETRWLLPIDDARRTPEAFRIYTPYAPKARLLKALAVGFIKAGFAPWGDRLLVASNGPLSLETLVAEVTGEREPVFALSIGGPGRYSKLTVQVMRRAGGILGYIKLPLTPEATARVEHEAAFLGCLAEHPVIRPHVPAVLHAGRWQDGYILFQSSGPARPGPTEFGPLHESLLKLLWSLRGAERPGHALVTEVAAEWQAVESRLGGGWRQLGRRAIERASAELDGITLHCGIVHGDFAPWNIRVEDGRAFLFDWEAARWDAPLLWDPFHFHVQVGSLLNRASGKGLPLGQAPGDRASFFLYVLSSVCWLVNEGSPDCDIGLDYRQRILRNELA